MEEQLWQACSDGKVEEVRRLLQNPQLVNINYQDSQYSTTPFYIACREGNIEIVKLLLNDERIDINKANKSRETPFLIACKEGHIEIVKLLLNNNRVDINQINEANYSGFTPFHSACGNGRIAVVELLLNDNRVDVRKSRPNGETPLWSACYNRHIEIVKLLRNDERVDLNEALNSGETPFYIACEKGEIDIITLLLNDERIDINQVNKNYETPFYIACKGGQIEIVKLLLNDERINVNKRTGYGTTPFWVACEYGQIEVVKLLLNDNRVEINKADQYGQTPFHVGCWKGNIEIVKLLLSDERIDINKARSDGRTPFYSACQNEQIELVKYLFAFGREIDLDKKDGDGKTVLVRMKNRGEKIIIELIESFLKNQNEARVKLRKELDLPEEYTIEEKNIIFRESIEFGKNGKNISILKQASFIGMEPSYFFPLNSKSRDQITHLFFKNLQLNLIQNSFENFQNLIHLDLSRNNLTQLPIQIRNLTNLININISNNKFETFPLEIENLINLTHLNFSFNKISTISNQIEQFFKLEVLNGSHNQINEFPNFLSKLNQIKEINLEGNQLTNQGNEISQFIQSSNSIQSLLLCDNPFTPQDVDPIVQTLNRSDKMNLKSIKIHRLGYNDKKIQLLTTKGLETLPIEIQSKSNQEIIDYILDLLQSGKSIYRSKLMIVGYERIGKTTLLDCLLPLIGYLYFTKNDKQKKYWFQLQGKYLHRFKDESENELIDEIVLENKQWKLNILSNVKKIEDKEYYGFELIRDIKPKRRIEYYCENENERNKWIDKLNRLIENKSTHGIDIQNHKIKPKGKEIELDISVWDFAGQHEYYNNHHHFLSARSLFLVCWKINEGEKGLDGLKFWLESLKFHLNKDNLDENTNKPLFTIFIVGTHLDHYSVNQDDQSIQERREKIQEILNELDIKFGIEIIEISSMNLENIEDLQTKIWDTISNHSYMGERVPSSYLTINDEIQQMKHDFGSKKDQDENEKEVPIIELTKFEERLQWKGNFNIELIKRSLNLLTMWGECGYFGESNKLSDILIYQLKFLTKQVMAELFRPEFKIYFENGILENINLKQIWKDYSIELIEQIFELMEKFDVCFRIGEYQKVNQNEMEKMEDFFEGKSIIPSYLEMKTKEEIEEYFPFECPNWMIEKSRILKFEVIPQELISLILIKVQSINQEHLIWRNGIYFNEGVQLKCLLLCSIELNQLEFKIRGINFEIIKDFIEKIMKLIDESLQKYSNVSYQQGLISIQTQNFVSIEKIREYLIIPIEKRTKDQIELLNRSCLFQSQYELEKEKENNEWWTWKMDKKWELIETGLTKYKRIQITPNETEYYGKLEYLSIKMRFEIKEFQQIFAIDNDELRKAFSIYRRNTLAKQKESPSLFNKDDRKLLSNSVQRQQFYNYLDDFQNKFNELQSPDQLKVIPVFQGVKKEVVNKICHQGFGTACVLDEGYYGKGIYFTSNLDYAMKYTEDEIVILSLLILGNSFAITEHPFETDQNGDIILEIHSQAVGNQNKRGNRKNKQNQNEPKPKVSQFGFYGKPLQQGYQSHFTLVNGRDINLAFPIQNQIDSETRDEFVVFQDAQVLPLFVLSKQNNLL